MNWLIWAAGVVLSSLIGQPSPWLNGQWLLGRAYTLAGRWLSRLPIWAKTTPPMRFALGLVGGMLPGLLVLLSPWLALPLFYLAWEGHALMRAAAQAKSALDKGVHQGDYDQTVYAALEKLLTGFAILAVARTLLVLPGLSLGAGAALAWGHVALLAMAERDLSPARWVAQRLSALGRGALALGCALCAPLMGLGFTQGLKAFRQTPDDPAQVMGAALGIKKGGPDSRSPLSGDLTQAAFMVWLALGVWVMLGLGIQLLLGR